MPNSKVFQPSVGTNGSDLSARERAEALFAGEQFGLLPVASVDPLSDPLSKVMELKCDFLSKEMLPGVGASGEVILNTLDGGYPEIKEGLVDAICSFCDPAKEFAARWALTEFLQNAADNQKALNTSPEIRLKWDVSCDAPFIVVCNHGSPLFNPILHFDRSDEEIEANGCIEGNMNFHGATAVTVGMCEHVSYFWCNETVGNEVRATLKCIDKDAESLQYDLIARIKDLEGSIHAINLPEYVARSNHQRFDRFAVGALL